jgi:hypothetical protein
MVREVNGSRELGMGLLTVSVAAVACGIADYGEGIAFSAGAGGCLAATSAYGLFRLSSRVRSPPSRTDRRQDLKLTSAAAHEQS